MACAAVDARGNQSFRLKLTPGPDLWKQDAIKLIWHNCAVQEFLAKIFSEHGYEFGGGGCDVAGPGSGYQHLHSDDSGSDPFGYQADIRHTWWPPAQLLVGPILEDWHHRNGPMRVGPWSGIDKSTYRRIAQSGVPYTDEKQMGFAHAWIEARKGSLLIRDPRALHGGTPNKTFKPRSQVQHQSKHAATRRAQANVGRRYSDSIARGTQ